MNFDKKFSGKIFRFFEWLFTLVVINVLTVLISVLIITLVPAIVASFKTIKDTIDEGPRYVVKQYFKNLLKYSEKAFFVGLVVIIFLGIAVTGLWFYYPRLDSGNFLMQAGFVVMLIAILFIIILMLHVPLLLITFPKLTIIETFKTSSYVSFRYITSTLIMLIALVFSIIGVFAYPVWILVGLSGPMLVVVLLTKKQYKLFEQIDLEKIFHYVDEIIDNEEETNE